MTLNKIYHADCMDVMKDIPDKHFNLAICDPPYGIGEDGEKNHSRGSRAEATKYIPKLGIRKQFPQNTFQNFSEFQKIKLYLVLIILFQNSHLIRLVGLYGIS